MTFVSFADDNKYCCRHFYNSHFVNLNELEVGRKERKALTQCVGHVISLSPPLPSLVHVPQTHYTLEMR